MATETNSCLNLQKSLDWCEGTPVRPGIRKRCYYISKSKIAKFPSIEKDSKGRVTGSKYTGDFELVADQKWQYIDILPAKSSLKSDPQGEVPSQTQQNVFTGVHPGVGEEATNAAAYLNNCDNIFLVPDASGMYRVVGCEAYPATTTVAQDLGEGPTGTASTTITHTATDDVPSPFYPGKIEAADGDRMGDGSAVKDWDSGITQVG